MLADLSYMRFQFVIAACSLNWAILKSVTTEARSIKGKHLTGVSTSFALWSPINIPLIALQSTTLFFFPKRLAYQQMQDDGYIESEQL